MLAPRPVIQPGIILDVSQTLETLDGIMPQIGPLWLSVVSFGQSSHHSTLWNLNYLYGC
jgi:hypothetical protein